MTTPANTDFTSDTEVIVHIRAGAIPDSLSRLQFTAFWLDDYLPPDGVRGQVFYTSLDNFIAADEAKGRKVRVVEVPA